MKLTKINLFLIIFLIFQPFFGAYALNIQPKDPWQQEFRLNKKPSDYSEKWGVSTWGGAVSVISNGWLKLATGSTVHDESAGVVWKLVGGKGDSTWDGSKPSTIEFRVAVAAPNKVKYGAAVVIADEGKFYRFLLKPSSMTSYHLNIKNGMAELFKIGEKDPISTSSGERISNGQDKNYLYFGDSGKDIEGTSTWEFIRWTNNGILENSGIRKESKFGFERPLNFNLFPDDARQWENYSKSVIISDLAKVLPQSVLIEGNRKKGKWKILPFTTDSLQGKALSIYVNTNAPTIKLPLSSKGLYAIYVGLSTVPLFHNSEKSGVQVKLGKQRVYKKLLNELDWLDHKRDVIEESFFTVVDLKDDESIDFKPMPFMPTTIAYVRLVPITKKEYSTYTKDSQNQQYRNNIATIDGHGMMLYNKARTAEDILGHFKVFEDSDYGKWWYQITGADLVNYPSDIGTLAGAGTEEFPRWYDEEFVESIEALIKNEVNSLTVSRQAAAEQGSEFHVMVRPQAWVASMPFDETFNSKFYYDHPEWRCIDEYGSSTFYMSYAVPQVRQRLLDMIRETVEISDPDGVGILFNRGAPFMLWEDAFADEFKRKYGVELTKVTQNDSRIHSLRAQILTTLLTDLRAMLDSLGKDKNNKNYKISLTVLDKRQNNLHGLDIENWIKLGLVDDVAIPPGDSEYYSKLTAGSKTKFYPLILPWDNYSQPGEFHKRITSYYKDGVQGVGVWDADMEPYKKGIEPYLAQIIKYIGRPALIDYWYNNTMPRKNTFRVTKMDENEYSGWLPNNGF